MPRPADKAVNRNLPDPSEQYDANRQKQFTKFNKDNFWDKTSLMATPRYEIVKQEASKDSKER